jgi:hypothetical protein
MLPPLIAIAPVPDLPMRLMRIEPLLDEVDALLDGPIRQGGVRR